MQGQDVITVVTSPDVTVNVLAATDADISGTAPGGITNLTTVHHIPQGSYGNFTIMVNATSQVPFMN